MWVRAALYLRVSTQEQADEGFSLAAQLDRLRAYCDSQEWLIAEVYTDEGVSAKTADRPELQRLLADAAGGRIDLVLVYKLDRLTRSVVDLYDLLQTFDRHKVGFKSATEVFDTTTAIGRLFMTLVAALAQWEREQLGERVYLGMRQKALEGKLVVPRAPYGYRIMDGKLILESTEAEIVRRIFARYLDGAGAVRIARELQGEGVRPPGGHVWRGNVILYMIHNPIYAGLSRWGYRTAGGARKSGREVTGAGEHEAIIDELTFSRTQDTVSSRRKVFPRAGTGRYPLTGLLYCSCGGHMTGNARGSRSYYRCLNRIICTSGYGVRQERLEAALISHLALIAETPPDHAAKLPARKTTTNPDKLREALKVRKQRLWDAYEAGELEMEELKTRLARLRNEEERISQEASLDGEEEADARKTERRRTLVQDLLSQWEQSTAQRRKELVRAVVERIDVTGPNSIEVRLRD